MATVERVAIATQFVSATDGIDCSIFFRRSHFTDCVAIAMHLIVALFFPFLIEVCWLLYCVVYSLCNITQLEKQDNRKCIFATDGILEQNSVRRTFKRVATVTCLIMAAPHWCFCGVQWLFIHVIYIKCLSLIGKEGQLKKEVLSVAMMTNFGFGPAMFKGCGMGTLFVLVSPCFRENVIATCKILSFLCSLDNLLQKNVIVFFFGNQISKWRLFEKKGYFWPTFHIISHQRKFTKFLQRISHSHTYMYFAHPIDFFALPNFEKKNIRYGFSLVWVLVLIPIRSILEQSINNKMVSKNLSWNVYYWYVFTLMPNYSHL